MSTDFFPEAIAEQSTEDSVSSVFHLIYNFAPPPNTYLALNLQWPTHDIPTNYPRYLLSWHTEYMDVDWLATQCQRVYPRPVLCVTDWPCDAASFCIDNLECVTYSTFAAQINILVEHFGISQNIVPPQYKLSSLSSRITQYKKFITAYLLKNFDHKHMMLSWHAKLRKQDDNHGHPPGWPELDCLDFDQLNSEHFVNHQWDGFAPGFKPIDNGNWNVPGINLCAVNCTNETWHYNRTIWQGRAFEYPGPYLTEKTMKPLIAGRAVLAVGQYQSHAWLAHLGFSNDYGFDLAFDNDDGDLSRIIKLFKVLDQINSTPLDDLYQRTLAACTYNLNWIKSGKLLEHTNVLNHAARQQIMDWANK